MTSKLHFQDDSIQLIELSSERGSVEYAETESRIQSPTISKFKKKNKVDTPVIQSPNISVSSSSKISDIFAAQQTGSKKLKPIPRPRTKIQENIDEIKKSSETLDTTSGDVHSVFSSETQSYKDKLKSRFLSIKKQAELSAIKKEKNKSAKYRKKRSIDISDENLQKEDSVINSEISKHEKTKSSLHIQQQNADDFFCKIYNSNETNESENIPTSDLISTERKQSMDTFLDMDDFENTVVEFLLPENIDVSLYEKELFQFWQEFKKIDTSVSETRNVEEEGIYQDANDHITKTELTMLEKRLRFDEKEWFDINGQLKILPDPRLDNSYKPFPTKLNHSDFVNKYSSPLLSIPIENYTNIQNNTLEIAISDLTFRHHGLFSAEHVIAQKLVSLFEEYKKITAANLYLFYRKKLDALRFAKNRLESNLGGSGDCNTNIDQLDRYLKYLSEIRLICEKMYFEARKERTVKLLIINIWKSLKNIRETQKYSNTGMKLMIKITSTDLEEETEVWENNIKEEVLEIYQENERLYESEMNEYKKRKQEWKEKVTQNKETDEKDVNSQGDTPSTTTFSSELLEEKPKKPKKNYSEEQIKNEVIEKCKHCLRPPGEPIIEFEIIYNHPITETIENTKEKLRRAVVNKTQIFIKILHGKREICKSKIIPLNDTFICKFDEFISVKMFNNPEALILQIYEQINPINKRMLSTVNIQIPPFNSSISNSELIQENFTSKEFFNYNNTGVGTGIELTNILNMDNFEIFSEDNDCKLYLTGGLSYKIGWDVVNLELCQNPQMDKKLFPTIFDIEDLEEWVENYPDPQDPQNIMFFDFIQQLELKPETNKDYFRCDPDMEAFEFCSQEEIDNNLRFKLLKLRNQNDPEFKDIQVPIREKEVSIEIFKNFDERRKEEKITTQMFGAQYQKENIDVQRKWASKFLAQTENRIIELSKTAERRISLKDVLNEDVMPTVGSLGSSIMNWFQPKRPLRPARKQVKQIAAGIAFKDINILINILGAIHVPARKESTSNKSDQINKVSVRPFVTVSFRDICARTTVADGPNPVWNQEIILPIRNKTESITIASLQNIKETIKINLYDETVDDLIVDDRLRERNIHQQLGCNWLGSFEIPFKTLLYSNRIEGTFKINLPPILLGYELQTIRSFHTPTESVSQNIDTFVSVFITLQPTIGKIQPLIKCGLECNESLYVEEHITNWHDQYKILFPQRYFSPFVTTMNGEKCCVTRYLRPVKLPPLNSNLTETTEDQIAKYVSLIPFRENSATGLIADIWLSAEQLLTIMMGSMNDHAVLLTCYFMTIGLKCWLILGYGLPYGYAAYVLVRKKEQSDKQKQFYIYDVKTGHKYNIFESTCPLQKVFCAINDENLWGNIQSDDRLHLTKFNFRKLRDWLPLFDCDISAPASTFNQVDPTYYEGASIVHLQEKIERKLKKKIMDMRKHSMTTWNFHSNIAFKKILAKLEENHIREIGLIESPEHLFELQDLFKSYQIRGFAQHFRYTTIKDLIEFIHTSGIYLNDQPNLEFSLACFAQSYCNNAVIIWLYAATLIRKT